MSNSDNERESRLLPTRQVCRRYNVSDRTINRWERDPDLGFPKPVVINNRKYFHECDLAAFDRAAASARLRSS
jgi:predicted DNA-binding transcriptional regulator AlpA